MYSFKWNPYILGTYTQLWYMQIAMMSYKAHIIMFHAARIKSKKKYASCYFDAAA
jgi:hypothetical protein